MAYFKNGLLQNWPILKNGLFQKNGIFQKWPISEMAYFKNWPILKNGQNFLKNVK